MKKKLYVLMIVLFFAVLFFNCPSEDNGGNSSGGDAVDPKTQPGYTTTIAGNTFLIGPQDGIGPDALFYEPFGIAADGANLYIAEYGTSLIRKIEVLSHTVTTYAGCYTGVLESKDGIGTSARFSSPAGIITDGTNLYVTDTNNHTIRKIVISSAVVTTLAGSAGVSGNADGTGASARFNRPFGITTDGTNLYVADTNNHTIRKIVISSGVVTTFAGNAGISGSSDGTGVSALFNLPRSITTDGSNVYVADTYNHTIRKIVISSGVVTTFTGSAGISGSIDGTGTSARFYCPQGITTDGTNLYVADTTNFTIRKIDISSGIVTTFAGSAGISKNVDGPGTIARFTLPQGITISNKYIFVADFHKNIIRKIVK